MKQQYKHFLWDWNGTLLNDLHQSIEAMNELLKRRALPTLSTEHYLEVFDFPVYDYYETIGFDFTKEDWSIVAQEFMNEYHSRASSFQLHYDAKFSLKHFKSKGIKHYILSAMKQESIVTMLKHFRLFDNFQAIYGQDNHYASGKTERAQELIQKERLNPKDCLIIGDTIHDAEVAQNLGIDCILISNGHQSYRRLLATGNRTFSSLSEWINKF